MNCGGKNCYSMDLIPRAKCFAGSVLKVGDELMSAIRFRKTAEGNLPYLSYLFRKPEPLYTELKTVAFYVTAALIFLEVKREKGGMNVIHYQQKLGATAACMKKMMEATKGL